MQNTEPEPCLDQIHVYIIYADWNKTDVSYNSMHINTVLEDLAESSP